MLCLFKGEVKGATPLSPERFFELAEQQLQTLASYKQQGKILAGGVMAGRKGSYAIWDVDSIEELQELIAQLPMYHFIEVEIVPLTTFEHSLEVAKQRRASMR